MSVRKIYSCDICGSEETKCNRMTTNRIRILDFSFGDVCEKCDIVALEIFKKKSDESGKKYDFATVEEIRQARERK